MSVGKSRAEANATLGTAPGQHSATSLGSHASTEAMGALAINITRLESSLHDLSPILKVVAKTKPENVPLMHS